MMGSLKIYFETKTLRVWACCFREVNKE